MCTRTCLYCWFHPDTDPKSKAYCSVGAAECITVPLREQKYVAESSGVTVLMERTLLFRSSATIKVPFGFSMLIFPLKAEVRKRGPWLGNCWNQMIFSFDIEEWLQDKFASVPIDAPSKETWMIFSSLHRTPERSKKTGNHIAHTCIPTHSTYLQWMDFHKLT